MPTPFDRYMNGITDPELELLKGYLVIEAKITEILKNFFPSPQHLEGLRLGFYKSMKLLQGLMPKDTLFDQFGVDIWAALEALNKLRNLLAHRLEHGEVNKYI